MKTITRKKLNEIIKLIKNGATEKDILKDKFKRSKAGMTKWYEINLPLMTEEERNIITFKKLEEKEIIEPIKKNTELQTKEDFSGFEIAKVMNAFKVLESHENRLKELEAKLEEKEENIELESVMTILNIGSEVLKLKSVAKSIRINPELVEELNEIAEENLNYSKTNIWNQALKEFIDKYKK